MNRTYSSMRCRIQSLHSGETCFKQTRMPFLHSDSPLLVSKLNSALTRCYSISSKSQWANRQATDIYVKKRIKQNLRSRAAFKLDEIQSRFRLLKPGHVVLDLGAAPGGWSQIAARSVYGQDYEAKFSTPGQSSADSSEVYDDDVDFIEGEVVLRQSAQKPKGLVIAVDLLEIPPIPGVVTFQGDIHSSDLQSSIRETVQAHHSNQRPQKRVSLANDTPTSISRTASQKPIFDVILSDMAHSFSGHRSMDVPAVHQLCMTALYLALQPAMLKVGGKLVVKCLQGDGEQDVVKSFQDAFQKVKRFRPHACRPESTEFYLLGMGLKSNARM